MTDVPWRLAGRRASLVFMRRPGLRENGFYVVVLPILVLINLGLAVFMLAQLPAPPQMPVWESRILIGSGIICSMVAGWLLSAAFSRRYWTGSFAFQVRRWRQIVDTIFKWIEDQPLSVESIHELRRSLRGALDDRAGA